MNRSNLFIVPTKIGFRIREVVTPSGLWIQWEGLFTTRDGALAEIAREECILANHHRART